MTLSHRDRGERLLAHFKASASDQWVVLQWKARVDGPVRVAVLRSDERFATTAEEALDPASGQILVYEGDGDDCQDQDVFPGVHFHYTSFARLEGGVWERQHTDKVTPPHGEWHSHRQEIGSSATVRALDRLRLGLIGPVGGPGGM